MNRHSVLVVCKEARLSQELAELLQDNLNCKVKVVHDFGSALEQVIAHHYALALTEVDLGVMSGIDLLAAIDALRLSTSVILMDDSMNARSAVAALRLGAVDYLYKPLNLEFVLLRVETELTRRSAQVSTAHASEGRESVSRKREAWINPITRPAAFILRRPQFLQIEAILCALQNQTGASFAGLVDSARNIVSAAGDLVYSDLIALKRVMTKDYDTRPLANMLHEKGFTSSYLEGQHRSIFITDFGSKHPVSLVVICPVTSKQGIVWLGAKRAALSIENMLDKADQAQREILFHPGA